MWKVLVFASGSFAGSCIVLVFEGGTKPVSDVPLPPTDAKPRIEDLKVGRAMAVRREAVRREAMVEWSVDCVDVYKRPNKEAMEIPII
jgi:hypothetical protein